MLCLALKKYLVLSIIINIQCRKIRENITMLSKKDRMYKRLFMI